MSELISLADIQAARERIASTAVRTPLVRVSRARLRMAGWPELSDTIPEIYLKDESAQPIGSFKLRGAYNKIAGLSAEELKRGVITYSSGNHAQGVAYAARALGAKAVIVMPENAPRVKREATKAMGAEIVTVGPASTERKLKAEELVTEHGYVMVPPYDDEAIIAGQATCGVEILEQLPSVDLVLSPVSGGGLLSGVATGIKLSADAQGVAPPKVWGCEPALAADGKESFDTKRLTEWPAAEDDADNRRRAADAIVGRAQLRTYFEVCGRDRHRGRGRDSRSSANCLEGDQHRRRALRGGESGGRPVPRA